MKKAIAALFLLAVVFAATSVLGQEKTEVITVKSAEVNNRVVIVTVQGAGTRFELQCNEGLPACSTLQPGTYVMVRLPRNWAMYQCANVQVYRAQAVPENLGEKLGEYCLIEK